MATEFGRPFSANALITNHDPLRLVDARYQAHVDGPSTFFTRNGEVITWHHDDYINVLKAFASSVLGGNAE